MSRSRVAAYTNNPTNAPFSSYPHNADGNGHSQLNYGPRQTQPDPLLPPRMQSQPGYRNSTTSTASMPFASIGNMLSQPYESDSEPEDAPLPSARRSLATPVQSVQQVQPVQPVQPVQGGLQVPGQARAHPQTQTRSNPSSPSRKSSHNAGTSSVPSSPAPAYTPTPTFPQPARPPLLPHTQNQRSQHDPRQAHNAQAHPHPQAPQGQVPLPPQLQQQYTRQTPSPSRPTINTSPSYLRPHHLPQPSTPISPALAAPPLSTSSSLNSLSSLAGPGTPMSDGHSFPHIKSSPGLPSPGFAGGGGGSMGMIKTGSRDSTMSSSDSIRGFDAMKEKKALFRGGDDELMSPISPRPRREAGARNVGQGMRRTVVGMPGGEFWKRFSVMVRLDEAEKAGLGGKDSAWLEKDQKRKRKVRIGIIVSVVLVILIVIGVVAGVMITNAQKPPSPKAIKTAAQV